MINTCKPQLRQFTPQQRLLRMTKEERERIWLEESVRLAKDHIRHPEQVLPDFHDDVTEEQ